MMDKNKVTDLAKSLSSSCKQAVKNNQLAHPIASPAVLTIGLTILTIMVDSGINKQLGWASV
jgi:hypothetical protein